METFNFTWSELVEDSYKITNTITEGSKVIINTEGMTTEKQAWWVWDSLYKCQKKFSLEISYPEGISKTEDPNVQFQWHGLLKQVRNVTSVVIPSHFISDGDSLFDGCQSLETVDIDASRFTSAKRMFENCPKLRTIAKGNTYSNITKSDSFFHNCSSLTYESIKDIDMSSFSEDFYLFNGCTSLTSFDFSKVPGLTKLSHTFAGCSSLTKVENLGSSNIKSFTDPFEGCPLSNVSFDFSKSTGMNFSNLFKKSLTNTANVKLYSGASANGIFSGCSTLVEAHIEVASENCTGTDFSFNSCPALIRIYTNVPFVGENCFYGTPGPLTIYIDASDGNSVKQRFMSGAATSKLPENTTYVIKEVFEFTRVE